MCIRDSFTSEQFSSVFFSRLKSRLCCLNASYYAVPIMISHHPNTSKYVGQDTQPSCPCLPQQFSFKNIYNKSIMLHHVFVSATFVKRFYWKIDLVLFKDFISYDIFKFVFFFPSNLSLLSPTFTYILHPDKFSTSFPVSYTHLDVYKRQLH